jgi:chemotaxis protein methyltransferase CheR
VSARWLDAVGALFGWHVEGAGGEALARRIETAARGAQLDLEALCARALAGDRSAQRRLAQLGTVGETYFFRELEPLEAAVRRVAARGQPVHAWSAGCSTGEEAYSIAFLLDAHVGPGRFEVLATDLDAGSIEKAARGRYGAWSLRGEPPPLRRALMPAENGEVEVPAELRATVRFSAFNLLEPVYPLARDGARFSLIVCRNVLTYFRAEAAAGVLTRLAARLAADGLLVVGPLDAVSLPAPLVRAPGMPEGVVSLRAAITPAQRPAAPRPAPPIARPVERPVRSPAVQRIQAGMVALERGEVHDAEAAFHEALAQKELALAHLGLALCRSDLGDRAQARSHAARAQALVSGVSDEVRLEDGELTAGMLRRIARELAEAIG